MARAAAAATKKKNIIRVDFAGVETSSVVPEGEYIARIVSGKLEESGEGNEYIAWELKVHDGKYKNKTLYNNTSLQAQSLWATKRWLECMGVDVPDGQFDIELDDYADVLIGVVVEHDSYKGRTRSKIIDCFPSEEEGGEKEEDAEDAEEPSELPTAEEIGEMGKADLKKLVEEHDLDIELEGATSAQRRQVIKAIAEKAKEKPAEKKAETKTGKTSKKPAKVKVSEVNEADADELEKINESHELEVDLEEIATLRKKRSAIIDALEAKELLEDDS